MAELPPNQFTIQLHFSTAPEHHPWIVSDVLTIFGFDAPECEVNDFVYPMRTEHSRMLAPAVEIMSDYWSAWDEDIEPNIPLWRFLLGLVHGQNF